MSCAAEVRWNRKYPRGEIEEISPRFNRRAPPPNHDKCGPNCRFWLRKRIKYYHKRNLKLRDLNWKTGKKIGMKSYGLDFDIYGIWDVSHADTISEELEIYKRNLKYVKSDNKHLNRLNVNIHKLLKEKLEKEKEEKEKLEKEENV